MAIFGFLDLTLDSKKILQFFISYTKSFLDFGREPSQCLKISALETAVSYKLIIKRRLCMVVCVQGLPY